jgi:hypothetical protein
MEQVRKEFEGWVMQTMGIDCSEMRFGRREHDIRDQYIDEDDEDGATAVSGMLYAYIAGRASANETPN